MKKTITTALFDLDGVLIDSAKLIEGSFEYTLALFNTGKKAKDVLDGGSTIREVYGKLTSKEELPKFLEAHAAFQKDNLHLVTPFQDAIATLETIRAKGIHIGIITNRSINARYIIEHCKLNGLVDLVISVEDVKNPKPHPEGIQKAMAHFESKPSETIMVGDMPVDIEAGKAAGVITVGLNTNGNLWDLKKSGSDYITGSLAELVPLLFN